jgi:predicted O-methyltransferase YrrM
MDTNIYVVLTGAVAGALVLRADLRRRRLSLTRAARGRTHSFLDIVFPPISLAIVGGLAVKLILVEVPGGGIPWRSPAFWGIVTHAAIFVFLWREGHRQIQFQRPRGIVMAEWLILAGANQAFIESFFLRRGLPATIAPAGAVIVGGLMIAKMVPPFVKKGSECHRILEHLAEEGESVQQEYTSATRECPNPGQWKMVDSQTTELEVLDFLKELVTTIKPSLIVETGTFLGYGTLKLAEGAKANGFGRVVTIEFDPVIYAKARERIEAAGLSDWVECRNESSLETRVDGTIDFYFSDSALAIREQEIRRLLPQIAPNGVIAIHDASSQFEVVRAAALRMEQEGLLSLVLLSTPRGLVLAQKRAGRM